MAEQFTDAVQLKSLLTSSAILLSIWKLSSLLSRKAPTIIKAPKLSESANYPSNFYPGGRTIPSPYGDIRLYEFGPKDGRKVLFIHGITTPCPVFKGILSKMTDAGFRVCTFDLWGRGYTDSPDSNHDARLFTVQILSVLQAVGWSKCSIVGYSLGGGLASAYTSWFPQSVEKLVLIAPAGLLARSQQPITRKIALSEYTPYGLIDALKQFVVPKPKEVVEQVTGGRVDVTKVSLWQTDNHEGFKRSYLSSFRYAPIFDQWELYERLRQTKVPVYAVWGENDDVVLTDFCSKNLQKALPEMKLTIIDDVAHDICTAKPAELFEYIKGVL